ncbi:MAG: hypothetical protein LBB62_05675, partial [Proteiniphilum sp.]|nr:hypothetical protein [Proteiniphilum sp.]
DDGPNATKGLEFPRVELTDENNLYPMFYDKSASEATSDYKLNKTILDKTHCGLVVYNTNTTNPFQKGLYIWNESKWVPITGTSSAAVTPWRESVTGKLSDSYTCDIYRSGNVTIGMAVTQAGDIIDEAALNVTSASKGILLPKVDLKSSTDVETLGKTSGDKLSEGLLVYNVGKTLKSQGYMYWSGTEWRLINNVSSASAQVNNWFYMPPIAFATDQDKQGETKDLYALYKAQFETPVFKSNGAPTSIPYIPVADQLYYYITYADPAVFKINSISEKGIMNYDVTAAATEASFINIVFVLK